MVLIRYTGADIRAASGQVGFTRPNPLGRSPCCYLLLPETRVNEGLPLQNPPSRIAATAAAGWGRVFASSIGTPALPGTTTVRFAWGSSLDSLRVLWESLVYSCRFSRSSPPLAGRSRGGAADRAWDSRRSALCDGSECLRAAAVSSPSLPSSPRGGGAAGAGAAAPGTRRLWAEDLGCLSPSLRPAH